MFRTLGIGLVCVFLVTGCMPSYRYGRTSMDLASDVSTMSECYRLHRMQLAASTASWQYQTGGAAVGWVTTTHNTAGGITLFQGGKRLKLRKGLVLLGDAELEQKYWRIVEDTEGAHGAYKLWRAVSLGAAFGGLGMTLGALGIVLADNDARPNLLLYGGAAVAVLSIIPTILASMNYTDAIVHDRYREIFSEKAYASRLDEATARYNAAVQQDCESRASTTR